MAAGNVTVAGVAVRSSRILQHGEVVTVELSDAAPPRTIAPHHVPVVVCFEDEHLAVIDKAAGMVVHPAPGHWDDTLVNALVARGTDLAQSAPGRPGIVHRLDRDTSGLMLVAKNDLAHRRLGAAIAARLVKRTYAALAWGHLNDSPTEVNQPIGRHATDRKRMVIRPDGRPARTDFEVVARYESVELLRAELHSGRTHQIRVHLQHLGHPVVGDAVYGSGGSRRISGGPRALAERLEGLVPRHALHAALLRFKHPITGVPMSFRSEWPQDLVPGLQLVAGQVDPQNWLAYLEFFKAGDD